MLDDVAYDDMTMEKYHLKDQELSLEELYLTRKMWLGEQASYDHIKCKYKSKHYLYLVRRSNLGYNYLKDNIFLNNKIFLENKTFLKTIIAKQLEIHIWRKKDKANYGRSYLKTLTIHGKNLRQNHVESNLDK